MSTPYPESQLRDLKHPDEIDELFGHANPNPDRVGCPPRDVAIALARKELPLSDPGYKHLTACSPCYLEVRAIQETDQERRRGRVIRMITRGIAAAAVLVLVTAAWFFFLDRRAIEVSVELDLRPYALTRGEPQGTDRPPLALPRARVDLTLLLPVGSEPGAYEVQLVGAGAGPRRLGTGEAEARDFVTALRVQADLHALLPGSYQLAIIEHAQGRQLFPLELR